jgi:hypothetical protein
MGTVRARVHGHRACKEHHNYSAISKQNNTQSSVYALLKLIYSLYQLERDISSSD